jgi:hypothetical protein
MSKKDDFELTPSSKKPWWKNKKIMIPLVLVFIVGAVGSSGDSEEETSKPQATSSASEETQEPVVAEEPVKVEPSGGEYGEYSAAQAKFISIIETAKDAIGDAETDLQRNVALRARDKDLCATLGNNKATDWTGLIDNVGANGEGKAYVEIKIADRITIKTWNNALSDFSDNTLIPTSSDFFNNLVAMKDGDLVKFSATFLKGSNSCLTKANMTEIFYGISPEFIVKFSNVTKE